MSEPKSGVRWAVLEAGLVVLGVVLALGAQAWWEGRQAQDRADAALANIVLEMRGNLAEVERSFEYHVEHVRAIQTALSTEPPLPDGWGRGLFYEGYVRSTDVVRSAWESAEATGALERIEYDRLLLITRVYALQDRYQRLFDYVGHQLFAAIFEPRDAPIPEVRPVGLRDVIGALSFREAQLAQCYRVALHALGVTDVPEVSEDLARYPCPETVVALAEAAGG